MQPTRPIRDAGNPCFIPLGDNISPAGGHWVDVRVKERPAVAVRRDPGAPSRNVARARVEIRPRPRDKFLPLAIPNNVIDKVQVQYLTNAVTRITSPLSTNIGTG